SDGSSHWMTVDTAIPVPAFQPDGTLFVSATATDTDGDTIDDGWEEVFGTKADFSLGGDFDNDGLVDEKEFSHGSDPTKADSDDDGVPDVIEEGFGSKSNNAESDGDGISDFDEVNGDPATNPGKADSDDDGSIDPVELAWGSDPNDGGDTPFTFVVADSIGDWSTAGTQGENGWTYGYYDLTDEEFVDGVYQTGDFQAFANTGGQVEPDGNHWAGAGWDMANGASIVPNVPWTFLGQEQGHPNGTNNGVEHWAIRRWAADELTEPTSVGLIWNVRAQNTNGDGTTGVLMVNGAVVDELTVAGNDAVGEVRRVFANLNPGDVVDLALTPEGLTNRIDGSDGSLFWYRVDTRLPAVPQQPDGRYFIPLGSADTDGDDLADFWEEIFFPGDLSQLSGAADFDEDGLSDLGEMQRGGFPNVKDTDGDGLEDGRETGTGVVGVGGDTGTDVFLADTDGDGKYDGDEVDGATATDPHAPDSDFDGLSDGQETNTGVYVSIDDTGSDPNNIDSDGDSLLDGDEVFGNPNSDPNLEDSDGDLLTDVEELGGATDPWLFDSDGDGWGDGEELTANTFPSDTPDFGLEKPATNEIANSEFDFTIDDVQGDDNGWLYGYRNVTVDGKGVNYDAEDDFIAFEPEHWNGRWDLGGGAPWTEVSATGGHPNGTNNGEEHWPMYRWVAGVDTPTPVLLTWNLRKSNANGGNGTSVGLYLNGTFLSGGAVGGTDGIGRYGSHYAVINPGDIVDLTLKPAGPNGVPADGSDGSFFGLSVDTELSSDPRQPDGSRFVIGEVEPLTVASVEFDAILRSATIVWNSVPGKVYEMWMSDDLITWTQQADELNSGGETTSYSDEAIPANVEVRYYQVREVAP
ncbi:MAG: hypothetical protein P8J87_14265, partial [Verrucomicrobiales bacterium]|nr:hypothetical protein [Verrucomicrobiales bacterium]